MAIFVGKSGWLSNGFRGTMGYHKTMRFSLAKRHKFIFCVCLGFPILRFLRNPQTGTYANSKYTQRPDMEQNGDQVACNCDHLVMDRHRGSGDPIWRWRSPCCFASLSQPIGSVNYSLTSGESSLVETWDCFMRAWTIFEHRLDWSINCMFNPISHKSISISNQF